MLLCFKQTLQQTAVFFCFSWNILYICLNPDLWCIMHVNMRPHCVCSVVGSNFAYTIQSRQKEGGWQVPQWQQTKHGAGSVYSPEGMLPELLFSLSWRDSSSVAPWTDLKEKSTRLFCVSSCGGCCESHAVIHDPGCCCLQGTLPWQGLKEQTLALCCAYLAGKFLLNDSSCEVNTRMNGSDPMASSWGGLEFLSHMHVYLLLVWIFLVKMYTCLRCLIVTLVCLPLNLWHLGTKSALKILWIESFSVHVKRGFEKKN